jgi:hypothetical protein
MAPRCVSEPAASLLQNCLVLYVALIGLDTFLRPRLFLRSVSALALRCGSQGTHKLSHCETLLLLVDMAPEQFNGSRVDEKVCHELFLPFIHSLFKLSCCRKLLGCIQ